MNKDELIKIGLTAEQATAVLNLYKPATDAFAKLESVSSELQKARETIDERNNQIEGLKTANAESKSLRQQIEALQAQNRDNEAKYKSELLASRKAYAVRQALVESEQKPQNVKIVMDQLDLDKVFIDENGNLTGLQEQQARLIKEAPYLFKIETNQPQVKNGFSVHGASAESATSTGSQQQASSKPSVANADFGRQLAAISLRNEGLKLQNNV